MAAIPLARTPVFLRECGAGCLLSTIATLRSQPITNPACAQGQPPPRHLCLTGPAHSLTHQPLDHPPEELALRAHDSLSASQTAEMAVMILRTG
eukprot:COSAG01_NODE_4358_length_5087_cov_2.822049_4_plen_94_part_00